MIERQDQVLSAVLSGLISRSFDKLVQYGVFVLGYKQRSST